MIVVMINKKNKQTYLFCSVSVGADWLWQHKTRNDTKWTTYSRNHNKELTSAYRRQQEVVVIGVHLDGGKIKRWEVDLTEMEQRPNPMPAGRHKRRLVRCVQKNGKSLPAIGTNRVLLWKKKGMYC